MGRKGVLQVYISYDILNFLKEKVKIENERGLGATLSGFTERALERFLTNKYGFKFLSRGKNE